MFGPIDHFIFDLSGTLLESSALAKERVNLSDVCVKIPELLSLLKKNHKEMFIFTTMGRSRSLEIITDLSWEQEGYFSSDKIRCGDDGHAPKPSGEALKDLVTCFDLDPNKTAMIGDSTSDILAAKEAGLRSVAALWDGASSGRSEKAIFSDRWLSLIHISEPTRP